MRWCLDRIWCFHASRAPIFHVHARGEAVVQEEEDDRHPAGEKALWDSVIDGSNCEFAAPEIFKFDQKIMMHLHDQPYHPSNKRITLRVRLEDLKMKYGLSDEAIIHIVTVRTCGAVFQIKCITF